MVATCIIIWLFSQFDNSFYKIHSTWTPTLRLPTTLLCRHQRCLPLLMRASSPSSNMVLPAIKPKMAAPSASKPILWQLQIENRTPRSKRITELSKLPLAAMSSGQLVSEAGCRIRTHAQCVVAHFSNKPKIICQGSMRSISLFLARRGNHRSDGILLQSSTRILGPLDIRRVKKKECKRSEMRCRNLYGIMPFKGLHESTIWRCIESELKFL